MKLLSPSKAKISSEILGDKTAIPNYFAKVEIKNWECRFLATFEFFMKKFIPVKKITNIKVSCSDPKVLIEVVRKNIERLLLTSDCPEGKISLKYEHRLQTSKPVNINSNMFLYEKGKRFREYCHNDIIAVIGESREIHITAEVEEGVAIHKYQTRYNVTRPFRRTGIIEYNQKDEEYDVAKCFDYEYNKGYFEIEYQDDRKIEELYKTTKETMFNFIKNLHDNFDSIGYERIGELILPITDDQSLRIANLIFIYTYSIDPVKLSYNITRDIENNGSILKISSTSGSFDDKKKSLLSALALLIKDIGAI